MNSALMESTMFQFKLDTHAQDLCESKVNLHIVVQATLREKGLLGMSVNDIFRSDSMFMDMVHTACYTTKVVGKNPGFTADTPRQPVFPHDLTLRDTVNEGVCAENVAKALVRYIKKFPAFTTDHRGYMICSGELGSELKIQDYTTVRFQDGSCIEISGTSYLRHRPNHINALRNVFGESVIGVWSCAYDKTGYILTSTNNSMKLITADRDWLDNVYELFS
jgi:hypothetical protein